MPSSSPALTRVLVIAASSSLGVGSPEGWLCASTTAAALSWKATLKISLGWTREAFRLPMVMTRLQSSPFLASR